MNRSPSIAVSNHVVVLGHPLEFTISASDADQGTTFTYSAIGLPQGASLDASTGQFSWTPGPGQAGDYAVVFGVSDGLTTTTRAVVVRAAFDDQAPSVNLELTPSFPARPGQQVLVHAIAGSLARIESLVVKVDGQQVPLDEHGRARVTAGSPGKVLVEAWATDADGLIGYTSTTLKVRDPADTSAPVLAFAADLNNAVWTGVINIVGSVSDTNLDFWRLEFAPLSGDAFVVLASGESPVTGATLVHFDPGAVANGFYRLRLTAEDIGGRTSTKEVTVEVNTPVKSAQFQYAETDLTVTLGGVAIDLVRQYDSLSYDQPGRFGFGWRFANRDVNIETSATPTGREALGDHRGFEVGTRVYLTLPDGRRVGFTFAPEQHELSGVTYYTPAFTADPGVDYALQSASAKLTLARNLFFDLLTAVPYNPANSLVQGPDYTLTAPDGTVYHLDTQLGVTEHITPAGVHLYFGDSGIMTSTGEVLHFETNAAGSIAAITAPDGRRVVYDYDEAGKLTAVYRLAESEWTRYAYSRTSELLDLIASSEDDQSLAIVYAPTPQVVPVESDLGAPISFVGKVSGGQVDAAGIGRHPFSLRESELRSTANGTVFLSIEVFADPGSLLEPTIPVIVGLTPLVAHVGVGNAFAMFAIDRSGLQLLEIVGADSTTSGNYSLRLSIAGDVNSDGVVDGTDAQAVADALGTSTGDPQFSPAADLNRDGTIDATDAQIVAGNSGFAANQAPTVTPTSILTHVDLAVSFDFASIVTDPELDRTFMAIVDAQNGTAVLGPDGRSIVFLPASGFFGTAEITIQAADGYGTSAPTTVFVNVSDAPLIRIEFEPRAAMLVPRETADVKVRGDFADEEDVFLPASYVAMHAVDPSVASVDAGGKLTAIREGSTILLVSSRGIQAATVVNVVDAENDYAYLDFTGLDVYPTALALPSHTGIRQSLSEDQWRIRCDWSGDEYPVLRQQFGGHPGQRLRTNHCAFPGLGNRHGYCIRPGSSGPRTSGGPDTRSRRIGSTGWRGSGYRRRNRPGATRRTDSWFARKHRVAR